MSEGNIKGYLCLLYLYSRVFVCGHPNKISHEKIVMIFHLFNLFHHFDDDWSCVRGEYEGLALSTISLLKSFIIWSTSSHDKNQDDFSSLYFITLMMTGCVLEGNIKGPAPCGELDYSTTTR